MNSSAREILEFAVAIAAAWLFYQGLGFALGTSMPMVSVVSESMLPTLQIGDLMIVKAENEYRPGDIAVYLKDGITIIHRIVEVRPEGYVFKGDNNAGPDPGIVPKERVMGRARLAIPLLGYPRLALLWLGFK